MKSFFYLAFISGSSKQGKALLAYVGSKWEVANRLKNKIDNLNHFRFEIGSSSIRLSSMDTIFCKGLTYFLQRSEFYLVTSSLSGTKSILLRKNLVLKRLN